ncbi:hypothetical protein Salat_1093200 [Sesamum alatum]|uniref:Retrovirus-related Pol polyprotein from transposon TNT 1-94 n=1 Tax=Sesamum alatum TaxID=300844 RepID=A0AAE2CT88_9LAMI|nr:hypothetical protein Salat_1093200 [Sesamum alatum]
MEVIKKGSTSTTSTTTPSPLLARNDVTRFAVEIFDGTGHFGMWQGEVLDALFQQGLDIALEKLNPGNMEEEDWNSINCLYNSLIYVSGTTMNDHIINFNQLVTDLMNMDETFKDEDLALMLLGSLPEEFEFLEMALLHEKNDVSLREVCAALYSYELRKKDKQRNSNGDAEALVVRGRSQIGQKEIREDPNRITN